MERTHLSPKLIKKLFHRYQTNSLYKPTGFWYQVDNGWEDWMLMEDWQPMVYKYKYSVDVSDLNILYIQSASELDIFTEKFKINEKYLETINWLEVIKLYDGVEIAPYIYERRLTRMWYYGWDCASGVVWNIDNVKLKLLGKYERSNTLSAKA